MTAEYEEPRDDRIQTDLDDAADSNLARFSLPSRPRGFDWFVELPEAVADFEEIEDLMRSHLDLETPRIRKRRLAALLRQIDHGATA